MCVAHREVECRAVPRADGLSERSDGRGPVHRQHRLKPAITLSVRRTRIHELTDGTPPFCSAMPDSRLPGRQNNSNTRQTSNHHKSNTKQTNIALAAARHAPPPIAG